MSFALTALAVVSCTLTTGCSSSERLDVLAWRLRVEEEGERSSFLREMYFCVKDVERVRMSRILLWIVES